MYYLKPVMNQRAVLVLRQVWVRQPPRGAVFLWATLFFQLIFGVSYVFGSRNSILFLTCLVWDVDPLTLLLLAMLCTVVQHNG